jgi:hypothetical protein
MIKTLVDPSEVLTLSISYDIESMAQKIAHNYVCFFDNITKLPDLIQDLLCRAITGTGFMKRELFTVDEEIIYKVKHCLGLTGVNLAAYYALKDWIDFRASYGEKITGESWLMRDLWQITNMNYGAKRNVMKPANVEVTMGHDLRTSESYWKPTEREILDDYLKAVPLLTINSSDFILQKQVEELLKKQIIMIIFSKQNCKKKMMHS